MAPGCALRWWSLAPAEPVCRYRTLGGKASCGGDCVSTPVNAERPRAVLQPPSLSPVPRVRWQRRLVPLAGTCFGFRCGGGMLPLAKAGSQTRGAVREGSWWGCSPPAQRGAGRSTHTSLTEAPRAAPSLGVPGAPALPFLPAGSPPALLLC